MGFRLSEEGEKFEGEKFKKHCRSLKLWKPDFRTSQTFPTNSLEFHFNVPEFANTILDYHVSVGATNGESAENWRTRILRLCIVRRR